MASLNSKEMTRWALEVRRLSTRKNNYKTALTKSEKDQLIKDITTLINDLLQKLTIIAFAKEED